MENLINDTIAPKKNYAFVDAIRCIAMMSVVMEHAIASNPRNYIPKSGSEVNIISGLMQFGKFGTICFFLLSGFLIGEKFTDYSPVQYLKRRLDNTFIPWIVWTTVFLLVLLIDDAVIIMKFDHGVIHPDVYDKIWSQVSLVYLFSSFWFIPNFLICIMLLLIFKKWLYKNWLGAIFLLFTLAYAVNIYFNWIEPRHSTAVFGFVFFLWLGAKFNRHLGTLEKWVASTPYILWIVLCIATYIFSIWEAGELRALHSVDPFNTLRFSNILYSLSCFFLLLRIREFRFISILKPRETTYGIYLLQFIIVYSLLPVFFNPIRDVLDAASFLLIFLYLILRALITYAIAFTLVTLINKTRLKWIVGR